MLKMYKNLLIYTALMLLIPMGAWAAAYAWLPEQPANLSLPVYALLWLTESGSPPYAVATALLLTAVLTYLLRRRYAWQTVLLLCALSLGSTQAVKSLMKNHFQEPRPFVDALVRSGSLPQAADFYRLSDTEQSAWVWRQAEPVLARADRIQAARFRALAAHQARHHDYSFPSGHTIFAVSWLLLFAGFGLRRRVLLPVAAWAGLMLLSRLLLGMHYPIDLFVSTLAAALLHTALFAAVLPRLHRRFPVKVCHD